MSPAQAEMTPASLATEPAMPVGSRWIGALGLLALATLAAGQAYGLLATAPDRDMGDLQKIMYVHVPAAWNTFLAYTATFCFSILYLWKREAKWDLMAMASAEVGLLLNAMTLALGSIWGRPTWGVWWTWDPRLTTTAIMMFIFVGYLALRSFVEEPEKRARWGAAVAIFGFLNVPVVYMSVKWWRTLHQVQSTPSTVDPTYAFALRINAIAFMLVMIYFIGRRYRAAQLEQVAAERFQLRALGNF